MESERGDWTDFLPAADQWFITYALPPLLFAVKPFAIGHVVELYLKAAYTKHITHDINQTIRQGHNLKRIWDECKANDANFMPHYELREHIFQSNFLITSGRDLDRDDYQHFIIHFDLYLIMKHLTDLKYLGTPWRSVGRSYSIRAVHPDFYWTDFLKELRTYLNYPQPSNLDWIREMINRNELPPYTVLYLGRLYT